ncbi:hypothetical protein NCS52_01554000 [Fusarium sp. LHS14.1]|nr:hypothetical protein NCS52_01554000 [Fusarium sp. LHS14.1]
MKHPSRKHHSGTHDSRARPYPPARHQTDRKSRISKARSRRSQDADPPRSTHSRSKNVARRDAQTAGNDRRGGYGPRSPSDQVPEGESSDYESERGDYGGNYDGDSASDSGEENTSPSRSELEQLKELIIELRREQSQQ